MDNLVIYGTGALARSIVLYNERYRLFNVKCFIDDNMLAGESFMGFPVLHYGEYQQITPQSVNSLDDTDTKDYFLVTIGYTRANTLRAAVCNRLKADGYHLANFISPGSNCWSDTIKGENILVFDNAFVGIGCELHDGVIISEGVTLSHDVIVEPYCFFSDAVAVGGHACIGRNSFLGLNSTIKSNTRLGPFNIVGCAANVLRDTESDCVAVGNPARYRKADTREVRI